MSSNHYKTLGVRQSDTDAVIRRAAHAATEQINADMALTPQVREARLADIQAALTVLTTPASRDRYDASLASEPITAASGSSSTILMSPLAWGSLIAIVLVGGGLYWQYEREQGRMRLERERIVSEKQAEQRAREFEAQRVVEKDRLLAELRSQRENDDKQRQQFNEIRSADSQKRIYVVDERIAPAPPTNNYGSGYDVARRNYEDQRQFYTDAQRRSSEENKQQYEDAANLQRARAEVERQKRFLEQREREEQYSRAQRDAASQPNRY